LVDRAGRTAAGRACAGLAALAPCATSTPGRPVVRRHPGRRGHAARAGGRHVRAAAPRGGPAPAGGGHARRRCLAAPARRRAARTRVLGRRGRHPARWRLPPGRGCRRGRGPAQDRARALHRLDAGAAMIDALSAWTDLLPRLAWPWMLLALPAPWLARRWLSPVRHAMPALRVPWSRRIEDLVLRGEGVAARGMPPLALLAWCLLCLAAARPQQPGELL